MASMTTPSNAVPESLDSQRIALAVLSTTRPLYWSIRRELWENRSIYVAPLAVAVVGLLGFSISLIGLPRSMRELTALDPAHQRIMLAMPYSHAAWLLILTAFVVGMFYSLDALHGERRDRSILFWKSLPVSDLTTVLSKATIPLVVLPLLIFAIIVILQLIMLLLSTVVLLISDAGARTLWTNLPLFQMQFVLLYGLAVLALWHAPLYVWLLLVSGWARRDVSMGRVASARDRRLREDCVPHFIFRLPAARPIVWIRCGRFCLQGPGRRSCRSAFHSADTAHSREIPGHAGSLDRAGSCRDIPRSSGAATPLS
jgi:ABC-2 type transport system permease protein